MNITSYLSITCLFHRFLKLYPVLLISGGCQYEGRIYEPGVTFTPDSAPCSVCVCNRGDVTCRPRPCKDLGKCKSSMTLPGDCCPTCMDCGRYANASMWKQGPCQKCSCIVRGPFWYWMRIIDITLSCDRDHCCVRTLFYYCLGFCRMAMCSAPSYSVGYQTVNTHIPHPVNVVPHVSVRVSIS